MRRYTVKMAASFEDAVALVTAALDQRGFRVVRSFDLAGTLDPDDPVCSCPHHGTERCTCRYTVLLVYAPTRDSLPVDIAPHSIAVHVRGGEAYIGLSRLEPWPESPPAEAATQEEALIQGLVEASLTLLEDP
ncbi:MAG: hypothetical protein ACE5LU_24640 [Anaerolineae bacterium]